MKHKLHSWLDAFRWRKLLLIWAVFLAMAAILFAERSGIRYASTQFKIDYLPRTEVKPASIAMFGQPVTCLLLYDSGQEGTDQVKEQFDQILLDMIDDMAKRYPGVETDKFFLFGHSGGGQFVNRFLFAHPEKLRACAIGAPGRPTFLNRTRIISGAPGISRTTSGMTLTLQRSRKSPFWSSSAKTTPSSSAIRLTATTAWPA